MIALPSSAISLQLKLILCLVEAIKLTFVPLDTVIANLWRFFFLKCTQRELFFSIKS